MGAVYKARQPKLDRFVALKVLTRTGTGAASDSGFTDRFQREARALAEIHVTYSKPMQDRSWSWSTWGEEYFPATAGNPRYLDDHRPCVLPVKLEPGKFYAIWLNSDRFKDFKDTDGRAAVPYLLTFVTGGDASASAPAQPAFLRLLNDDQRAVVAWTGTVTHRGTNHQPSRQPSKRTIASSWTTSKD